MRQSPCCIRADESSKTLCFVACTNYNRSDSRATQGASPLAHRSPNDDSASNNNDSRGILLLYFFLFFISSRKYIVMMDDGWDIVRWSLCVQANKIGRTWVQSPSSDTRMCYCTHSSKHNLNRIKQSENICFVESTFQLFLFTMKHNRGVKEYIRVQAWNVSFQQLWSSVHIRSKEIFFIKFTCPPWKVKHMRGAT